MRKMYKKKRRCCAMCKAHKRNGDCRWKGKEKEAMKRFARAQAEKKLDML